MKKSILATITLAALAMIGTVSFSTEANAQSWRNNSYNNNSHNGSYNHTYQNNQHYSLQELHSRIVEGLRSRQLTKQEANILLQKENSIKRQEWVAKRDGFITYQEQAILNRQIDQLAKDIFQEKHDSQNAYNPYGRRY